ncbi:hypothetical protein Btru_007650 [Bulinus truncatus]|nr:hypothetical protein Btru_007650 [Bulinus truncatus]
MEKCLSFFQTYDVGHTEKMTGVIYTPGAIFTSSGDKTIKVLEPTREPNIITSMTAHKKEIAEIDYKNGVLPPTTGNKTDTPALGSQHWHYLSLTPGEHIYCEPLFVLIAAKWQTVINVSGLDDSGDTTKQEGSSHPFYMATQFTDSLVVPPLREDRIIEQQQELDDSLEFQPCNASECYVRKCIEKEDQINYSDRTQEDDDDMIVSNDENLNESMSQKFQPGCH